MQRTVLIAIGGNSLLPAGEPADVATERAHVADTCGALAAIVKRGWRVVVTHGNGPQVGAALRRSELARAEAYPLPLDICVASTQGEIGVLLQRGLSEALAAHGIARPVATVLSQVAVAANDPAFLRPTKPIGLHGFQRVVPSPEPLEIVEEPVIRALVGTGAVVIALGGGGVPVVKRGARLEGAKAVVDKDLASALLAMRLGVDVFVMSTDVDGIYLQFATPGARRLGDVTADELRRYAAEGQFPAGSMGPKVEAGLRFVAATGREAIVTSPDRLVAALEGRAGTHILAEPRFRLGWRGPGLSGAPAA